MTSWDLRDGHVTPASLPQDSVFVREMSSGFSAMGQMVNLHSKVLPLLGKYIQTRKTR